MTWPGNPDAPGGIASLYRRGVDGHWRHAAKNGYVVLSDDRMVMTYDEDYLASGLPRMSLIDDVATEVAPFFEYPVTERMPMLPRLRALVPGNNPRNLQRAHYLKALQRKMGTPPAKGIDTEWALLLMGGHWRGRACRCVPG